MRAGNKPLHLPGAAVFLCMYRHKETVRAPQQRMLIAPLKHTAAARIADAASPAGRTACQAETIRCGHVLPPEEQKSAYATRVA